MALNRSRVDVLCVPQDIDLSPASDSWDDALVRWSADGLVCADRPTAQFIGGGAKGIRLDHPTGRVVYGNQLGGFHVTCPSCGAGLARAFASAMEASRQDTRSSPVATVRCPRCDTATPLPEVDARPPIQIGRCAVVFVDVGGVELTDRGREAVEELLGPFAVIFRRTS